MKIEFVCTDVSEPHESGYKARLRVPLPPPEPVADGYGNPIAHPRPFGGAMELFVTSDARRDALRLLYPIRRRLKKLGQLLRTELSLEERKAREAEQLELVNQEAAIGVEIEKLSKRDFRFARGKKYRVTFEEVPE